MYPAVEPVVLQVEPVGAAASGMIKKELGVAGLGRAGEIAVEFIVAVEPEELILLQRAAHIEVPTACASPSACRAR